LRRYNNRIEQDHRGIEQRYCPMRRSGNFTSAVRCCCGFEEQRRYFRAQARSGERDALAEQRRHSRDRWEAAIAAMSAA